MSASKKILRTLAWQKAVTALLMMVESVSAFIWRALFWCLFFAGLWLMAIPAALGIAGEIIALAAFAGGLIYFLLKDSRHLKWPRKEEILRRIERANNLKHRPLSSQKDTLANPRKQKTRQLWQERGKAMLAGITALRRPKLLRFVAAKDPYALRLIAVLVALSGLFIAHGQWDLRLKDSLKPFTLLGPHEKSERVSLWITPPAYTGREITVVGKTDEILSIPQGSQLKFSVSGGLTAPVLDTKTERLPLKELAQGQYSIEIDAPDTDTLQLTQMMLPVAQWSTNYIPDTPPGISRQNEIEILPDGSMRFPFSVIDDYGVKKLTLHMEIDPVVAGTPIGKPVTETRPIFSPSATQFDIQPVYDLTSHPWAGLPVIFNVSVYDDLEQTAALSPVAMTLPERTFHVPLAHKLVEMRKQLIWEPELQHEDISLELEEILAYPALFQNDMIIFLALRTAAARLAYTPPYEDARLETAHALIDLLWDTALRIEDGNLSLAARDLREKQKALQDLLDDPQAPQEEVSQAMQELREALAQYLAELHQELQKRLSESGTKLIISPEALANMISPDALADFLNEMENQLLAGDMESAQNMLGQLQRMMDNMNPSLSPPMPPDMRMMSEGINELEELIKQQESLLEQTRKQAELQKQDNMSLGTQKNKAEQEALRFALGQLMLDTDEVLHDIPEAMGQSEQEMREASNALGNNDPQGAVPHQEQAIENLKQSQQNLGQQLAQRMQQMATMMIAGSMMPRLDPLGRPMSGDEDQSGLFPGSQVEVPDEAQRQRVDEILKTLRQRAGQRSRPNHELEYYRRLLKRF